ncbi:tetrahydromethanopterin S-methyltransferase subunit A [Candidatus Thorarchaeota archaeon]|nr:MAG: tetrahydromethanopterin S-methyltransferase subunit A [Candidatus Thorarchaeota archaeon]
MSNSEGAREWPVVAGDFEVGNPSLSVAICTLGKKIMVDTRYAIIGTCKTENIGIERVVVNIISNPNIRHLILCGPEVPGHRTGSSLRCLHEFGVNEDNRKILEAPGAIPYIENIPLEAIQRFREQVELVDMMNVSDPDRIRSEAESLLARERDPFPEGPFWVDFTVQAERAIHRTLGSGIAVLPELEVYLDPMTSLLERLAVGATLSLHPTGVGVEVRETETGTVLVGKEL